MIATPAAEALQRSLVVKLRVIATEVARNLTRRGLTQSGALRLGDTSAHDGVLPQPSGGTGHERGAEPPLGNPTVNGQLLASTTGGVRSWVTPAVAAGGGAGGMVPLDPTTAAGDLLYRHPHSTTTLAIGFIGDSITHSHPVAGGTNPTPIVAADLSAHGVTVTAVEQGHDGAATADYLPGAATGYLATAKAAFAAAGVRLVHIMLGTNDAHAGSLVPVDTYRANLLAICADLVAAGYLPVLSYSPWMAVTSAWDATSQAQVLAFEAEIDSLIDGATTFQGDTQAYTYFQAHPDELADGVHPSIAGETSLAGLWAAALRPYVRALSGPLALDRLPLGTAGQVLTAGATAPQWATPTAGGGAAYAWEPLVTGLAAQSAVTTDTTPGDPVWANNDFIMVGTAYLPH